MFPCVPVRSPLLIHDHCFGQRHSQRRPHRDAGDLELIGIGLAGGDALQPEPGRRQRTPPPLVAVLTDCIFPARNKPPLCFKIAKDLKMIQMHLHHVLNCLEGKTGKDFDASFGNPCNGQGALETLKKDSPNWIRTNNSITLAKVGVKLQDEKPTRLVAEAVYAILSEGK